MQVKINSVGDAWRDWGIITAYKMLKNSRGIQKYLGAEPELAENMLIISFKDDLDIEGLKDVTQEYIKENLLNKVVLRDFSMKVLGYPRERDKSGFYNARYAIPLEKEEISKVNETAGQRPLNNKAGVTLRRNYVGITPDWEKAVKELPDLVGHFYDQLQTSLSAKEATFCPVCGLAYNKKNGVKMRQNKNPFFNQHHNNKVRGHANTVDIMSMCPVCNFLNSLAAFSANLPYFIGDTTNLLLPEISNLHVLDKVYSKFDELLDMESPTLYSYITNIPELTQRSLYPSIITLYFAIKNKYSAKIDQFIEDINWDQSDEPYLHRWHVIRYNKGQNVIFNVFSTVDVHHRLFQLVDDIYYGKENAKKGNLVQRFLPNWRSSDKRSINVLAQGIVSKDWHLVAQSLYEYCREESKLNFNSISFFEKFIMKAIGEVDELLTPELMDDVKVIANSIGRIFREDIALFTNLNNAYNSDALRKVLGQAFFKMNRIIQTNNQAAKDIYAPGTDRVERLLNSLNKENFAVIKDTLIIFASLNALRANKQKEEDAK